MQRLVVFLIIVLIGLASWKAGLWVGENNLRSQMLSKFMERPEGARLQEMAQGVNASGRMKAEVFVELQSVTQALAGIRYTVLSTEAEVYEAEPQRFFYELNYDKRTKEIVEVNPYARPIN